ncbi:MAG: hypothetical protein AABX39_06585 [Nanoarchaeota archaeon]
MELFKSYRDTKSMRNNFFGIWKEAIDKAATDLIALGTIHSVKDINSKIALLNQRISIMNVLQSELEMAKDSVDRDVIRMANALKELKKGNDVSI